MENHYNFLDNNRLKEREKFSISLKRFSKENFYFS